MSQNVRQQEHGNAGIQNFPSPSITQPSTNGTYPGYVSNSLVLNNGTLLPGNFMNVSQGLSPTFLAFDTINDCIYFTNYESGVVSVVNATTDQRIMNIPVGAGPLGIAFDSAKGFIYVANALSDSISVIYGRINMVISTIMVGSGPPNSPSFSYPEGIAYDDSNGLVYVTEQYSHRVSVIDPSSNRIVYNITVGGDPWDVTYDSVNGNIFVANSGSYNLTVINGTTNKVETNVYLGSEPLGICSDNINGDVYVTTLNGFKIISGTTGHVVYNITEASLSIVNTYTSIFHEGMTFNAINERVYAPAYDLNEIWVINCTTNRVLSNISVGSNPSGTTLDTQNNEICVSDFGSKDVLVVSARNDSVVARIDVNPLGYLGYAPMGIAIDKANDNVYVTDHNYRSVSVINGTSDQLEAQIPVGYGPNGILFDPANGYLYVAISDLNILSVINVHTNEVISNITVGGFPSQMAFDQSNDYVYVTNYYTSDVTVISGGNKVVSSIRVGGDPLGIAYDPFNQNVYVANQAFSSVGNRVISTVSIIHGTSVVGNVAVGLGPSGVAYDPSNHNVYVTSNVCDNVSVIGPNSKLVTGTSNLTVGVSPLWLAVDQSNGNIYVSNSQSDNVTVIDGAIGKIISTIGVGFNPAGIAYDPANGNVYVADYLSGSVSIISTLTPRNYSIEFEESGLPQGTSWNLTLDEITHSSNSSSIFFNEPNGSYLYSVGQVAGFYTVSHFGRLSVKGENVSEIIQFNVFDYSVALYESGLPYGTEWYVNLTNGQTFSSASLVISFSEPNGTYSYNISTTNKEYRSMPHSGSFMVNGKTESIDISFSLVTYLVTLSESGLYAQSDWYVSSNGTPSFNSSGLIQGTRTSYSLHLSNGTYQFSVEFTRGSAPISGYEIWPNYSSPGTITVNGTDVFISVVFTPLYEVTFSAVGLYNGSTWGIVLSNDSTAVSSNYPLFPIDKFSENLTNGTYTVGIDYSLSNGTPEAEYYPTYNKTLMIVGENKSMTVTFTPLYYVFVIETGLPPGTPWGINLNSTSMSGIVHNNSAHLFLSIPNGTYHLKVSEVQGFRANLTSSIVKVYGSRINVYINWTLLTYPLTITEKGLPRGVTWSVTLSGTSFLGNYVNQTLNSTTKSVVFNEPNGTYSYAVHLPSDYGGSNLTGTIDATGHVATARIIVHSLTNYALILIVVLMVGVIVLAMTAVIMKRKKKP